MSKSLKTLPSTKKETATKTKSLSKDTTKTSLTTKEESKDPKKLKTSSTNSQDVKSKAVSLPNKTSVSNKPKPSTSSRPTATTSSSKPTIATSNSTDKKVVKTTTTINNAETPRGKISPTKGKTTSMSKTSKSIDVSKRKTPENVAEKPIKPNAVLDTYHNVTVSSPPSMRKEQPAIVKSTAGPEEANKRSRKLTRTLDPEEVVLLKRESARQRLEVKDSLQVPKSLNKPLAFEVSFEKDTQKPEGSTKKNANSLDQRQKEDQKQAKVAKDPGTQTNLDAVKLKEDLKQPTAAKDPGTQTNLVEVKPSDGTNLKTLNKKPDDFKAPGMPYLNVEPPSNMDEETNLYSDDFESYESDFEMSSSSKRSSIMSSNISECSSSSSPSDINDSSSSNEADLEERYPSPESRLKADQSEESEDEEEDDESDVTQNPITVIQKEKEQDRKLDSGSYEQHIKKKPKLAEISSQSTQNMFDSLDTFSLNTSDQLDSGISSYESIQALESKKYIKSRSFYGGYTDFVAKPILNSRGRDLMTKISFDSMNFVLLDIQPISYEVYMQTYGKLYTSQISTQTNDNRLTIDTQTDEVPVRTIWTQHPPLYNKENMLLIQNLPYRGAIFQNCCGEEEEAVSGKASISKNDPYEESFYQLQEFQKAEAKRSFQRQLKSFNKPIDFGRLNLFLKNSAQIVSNILNRNSNNKKQETNETSINPQLVRSSFKLGTPYLNALRVVRVFSNTKFNLIVTVHECLPEANVYLSDFAQLLMVWSTNEPQKPIRLLSTWSEVTYVEICNKSQNIIVCGLRDGSLALWDLLEPYSYCSKLDGDLTHFAPTQTVVPNLKDSQIERQHSMDQGVVIDVKSFRAATKNPSGNGLISANEPVQFVSLNETGLLTLWTLVEVPKSRNSNVSKATSSLDHRFEYYSPWARLKLIQSGTADLKAYLEKGLSKARSQFEKTKALFQSNIYNNEVLKELSSSSTPKEQALKKLQGLRFTCLGVGSETIYICTNQNFIIACSRSLKMERFRKISINQGRYLFPTALTVLSNENFIVVGLSNGSVYIINCQQQGKHQAHRLNIKSMTSLHDSPTLQSPNDPMDSDSDQLETTFSYPEARPTTAQCLALIDPEKRPFEMRVLDQEMILSGSSLRQDLVKRLVVSSDSWKLFVLSNERLRVYDFYLEKEMHWQIKRQTETEPEKGKMKDISTSSATESQKYLVVLHSNQMDVEIYLLNQ